MKKRMTGAVMSLLILASSLAVSDSSTMGSALENEAFRNEVGCMHQ